MVWGHRVSFAAAATSLRAHPLGWAAGAAGFLIVVALLWFLVWRRPSAALRRELHEHRRRSASLADKVAGYEAERSKLGLELESARRELVDVQDLRAAAARLPVLSAEFEALREQHDQLEGEVLPDLRSQVQELTSRLSRYEGDDGLIAVLERRLRVVTDDGDDARRRLEALIDDGGELPLLRGRIAALEGADERAASLQAERDALTERSAQRELEATGLVSAARAELAGARATWGSELEQTRAAAAAEVADVRAAWQRQVAELVSAQESQVAEAVSARETQVAGLVSAHESDVAELVSTHESQVAELVSTHESQVAELVSARESQVAELVSTRESQVAELVSTQQSQAASSAEQMARLTADRDLLAARAAVLAARLASLEGEDGELAALRSQASRLPAAERTAAELADRVREQDQALATALADAAGLTGRVEALTGRIADLDAAADEQGRRWLEQTDTRLQELAATHDERLTALLADRDGAVRAVRAELEEAERLRNDERRELTTQLAAARTRLAELEGDGGLLPALQAAAERAGEEAALSQRRVVDLNQAIDERTAQTQDLASRLSSTNERAMALQSRVGELDGVGGIVQRLRTRVSELEAHGRRVAQLQAQAEETGRRLEQLTTERDRAVDRAAQDGEALERVSARARAATARLAELDGEDGLVARLEARVALLQGAAERAEAVQGRLNEHAQRISQLQLRAAGHARLVQDLQEQLADARAASEEGRIGE